MPEEPKQQINENNDISQTLEKETTPKDTIPIDL